MVDIEKQNILIVDDKPQNLLALEAILEGPDLKIIQANSGQEALWKVLEYDFAVVILDVQMPEMDGFETAELIRKRGKSQHVPIIYVTAISTEERYVTKGYEMGAVDYLFKPVEPEILKAKVNVFLELNKQRKLIERQAEVLKASETRFRSVSETATDAIITINSKGNIVFWNHAAEVIFGYTAGEVIEKSLTIIMPEKFRMQHTKAIEQLEKSGQPNILGKTIELAGLKKDNTEFPLELSMSNWETQGERFFTGIVRDITERKQIEKDLEESRQEQLKMKDQFLSHVSHELRSPLTSIHQFVSILMDGLAGELNCDQNEYMKIILKNANHLRSMIEDLLAVTRAGAGTLSIEPEKMSASEILAEVVTAQTPSAEEKQIHLSANIAPDLPNIYTDPVRVREILINLIGNALKFTPEQGVITAKADIYEKDPKLICFSVTDTGCGISPQGVKLIFERMFQEKTQEICKASKSGLGLGLYICKELVTRQGGEIWVESKLGSGSTFFFTLPIASKN